MKIHISPRNTKVPFPNISLPPGVGCPDNVPCKNDCYAKKFYKMYPGVTKAWDENWEILQNDQKDYFHQLYWWFEENERNIKFFRFHVAGDILNQRYYGSMCIIAKRFPNINFLAHTKRHDLDYNYKIDNLNIVFSMWPGYGNVEKSMPRSWMLDPRTHYQCKLPGFNESEFEIPDNALICPGSCKNCQRCWFIKPGENVIFRKH